MGLVHVPVSHLVCGFLSQTGYIVASLLTFSSVLFLALPVGIIGSSDLATSTRPTRPGRLEI